MSTIGFPVHIVIIKDFETGIQPFKRNEVYKALAYYRNDPGYPVHLPVDKANTHLVYIILDVNNEWIAEVGEEYATVINIETYLKELREQKLKRIFNEKR